MQRSRQLGPMFRLVMGMGFWFEAVGDAGQQQHSMLQMVRVPNPMASAELHVMNRFEDMAESEKELSRLRVNTTAILEVPIPPIPAKNSRFNGRGIAVAVNGADPVMLASAFALVRVVRRVFNSLMPIELFYLGPEERFPSLVAARFVAEGAVKILDLLEAASQSYNQWYDHDGLRDWRLPGAPPRPPAAAQDESFQADPGLGVPNNAKLGLFRKQRGWHVKPLTAMVSSFEEVVLMDADALPLQPPETFFRHFKLQSTRGRHHDSSDSAAMRMVLFRDHVHCLTSVSAWLLMEIGLSPSAFCTATAGQEIDSSAVIMDKSDPLVWKALHIAEALNRRWYALQFHRYAF